MLFHKIIHNFIELFIRSVCFFEMVLFLFLFVLLNALHSCDIFFFPYDVITPHYIKLSIGFETIYHCFFLWGEGGRLIWSGKIDIWLFWFVHTCCWWGGCKPFENTERNFKKWTDCRSSRRSRLTCMGLLCGFTIGGSSNSWNFLQGKKWRKKKRKK